MNELMLICEIAGRRAAIAASDVRSVIEIEGVTPIPGTPPHIAGLTALRSQALTLVDCRVALGFESLSKVDGARAAVVEEDGHLYALVVDEAYDVAETSGATQDVSGGFGHGWHAAARGMVETQSGPAILIDTAQLIAGLQSEAA